MMSIGGLVAQSVEHRPFKAVVPGSSPGQLTIFYVNFLINNSEVDEMSKVCAICGKTKGNGGCITRKGLAIKAGGIGMHVVKNVKRTFEVNLQNVKINEGGTIKTVKMCTACIRTGNYVKA